MLGSHRRATYVEAALDGPAADALRVFGEFADRLAGHRLDVVLLGKQSINAEFAPSSESGGTE